MRVLLTLAVGILTLTGTARAGFTNGSFETGTFAGWTTSGVTAVLGTFAGIPPTNGAFQGGAQTNGGVSVALLEGFFGLSAGALPGVVSPGTPTIGSGFQQVLTVQTGDRLTFDWLHTTTEAAGDPTFNDTSFLVIANTATGLADTFSLLAPGGIGLTTPYNRYEYVFPTGGTYNVGVGIMNVGDTGFNSVILADNFAISTPAPPALLLAAFGVPVLALIRRRRK